MKTLFDGREYVKIHAVMDKNGNKIAKVFFADGHTEVVKDARLPWSSDKFYKSLSALYARPYDPTNWTADTEIPDK